ncbi:MAG: myo-inositol-1-phosphate synthase [Planctomycetota bacterium]|nr:MAG: myo-inositol-1-phosphate synthase [Planctomycetota bacterium]
MKNKVGVWFIGASGAVATSAVVGWLALQNRLSSSVGLVSALPAFCGLDFLPYESFVLGGCDLVSPSFEGMMRQIYPEVGREFLEKLRPQLRAIEGRVQRFSSDLSRREEVEWIMRGLGNFQAQHCLDSVIVVNLASTMPNPPFLRELRTLEDLEGAIDENRPIPSSVLYCYGAFQFRFPYVNFTPSPDWEVGAIQDLAMRKKVVYAGQDGKTGETLLKSALAPLFAARNLSVLSWVGYNILGNRDGENLQHPSHRQAKVESKSSAIRSILGENTHTLVGIDYVPSLGDRKTAWDFVHFQGFLGAKMSLQFIWQGLDSLLAAPLVIDLIRFSELAYRQGIVGPLSHLASFFKSPVGCQTHHFYEQFQLLEEYARRYLKDGVGE